MSNGCCEHFSVPSPSGQIYNALVLEVLLLVRGGTLYNLRAGVNKRAVNFYCCSRLYDKKNRLYFKYYFNVRTNSHTFTLIGAPPPFLISFAVSLSRSLFKQIHQTLSDMQKNRLEVTGYLYEACKQRVASALIASADRITVNGSEQR